MGDNDGAYRAETMVDWGQLHGTACMTAGVDLLNKCRSCGKQLDDGEADEMRTFMKAASPPTVLAFVDDYGVARFEFAVERYV